MQIIKGVLWEHPSVKSSVNGQTFYRYVFGCILASTKPISGIADEHEYVLMGDATGLQEFLSNMPKMRPPFMLGDLTTAVMTLSDMNPNQMVPA